MKTPTVYLEWSAVCDLRSMPWHDRRELAGILMGIIENGRVVVRQIVTNPHGPQSWGSTTVEFDAAFDLETHPTGPLYKGPGAPPHRIIGTIHSHVQVGPPVASRADREHARQGSLLKGQDHKTFAAVIVAPQREEWMDRFPTGSFDWTDPHLRALIAVDGEVTSTVVTCEPFWLWKMRSEREEINAAHT